jgi:hypothetical protein
MRRHKGRAGRAVAGAARADRALLSYTGAAAIRGRGEMRMMPDSIDFAAAFGRLAAEGLREQTTPLGGIDVRLVRGPGEYEGKWGRHDHSTETVVVWSGGRPRGPEPRSSCFRTATHIEAVMATVKLWTDVDVAAAQVLRQRAYPAQPLTLLRHRPDRILPQLHYPQAVRTELRARPVATDRRQDRRDLRHTPEPPYARQARDRHRPHLARSSCLPGRPGRSRAIERYARTTQLPHDSDEMRVLVPANSRHPTRSARRPPLS